MKQECVPFERARVSKVLPNGWLEVDIQLAGKKHTVRGMISGKMRKHSIRVVIGDIVDIEFSPTDLNLGRVTFRHNR